MLDFSTVEVGTCEFTGEEQQSSAGEVLEAPSSHACWGPGACHQPNAMPAAPSARLTNPARNCHHQLCLSSCP